MAESYEVQGTLTDDSQHCRSLINQIIHDMQTNNPAIGITVRFEEENRFKLVYHSIENDLTERMKLVQDYARDVVSEIVKKLKSRYKDQSKKALKLKEIKKERDETVEKVSLNGRYYFRYICVYEIQ